MFASRLSLPVDNGYDMNSGSSMVSANATLIFVCQLVRLSLHDNHSGMCFLLILFGGF